MSILKRTLSLIICLLIVLIVSPAAFAAPSLTVNGSSTHTLCSMQSLVFDSSDAIDTVYVGSQQLIDPDFFSLSTDAKTVTLLARFLNRLNPSTYTIHVYNAAGERASATFTIEDCPLLVPDVSMAADSEQPLKFVAPGNGYYRFDYENNSPNYSFQYFDSQTNSWERDQSLPSRKYTMGESIYVRPMYDQAATGKLNVLVRKITPPAADSIEVSAPYSVTNSSMTLDFTLNVTEATAAGGYHLGLLWGPEPTHLISRNEFDVSYTVMNGDIRTSSRWGYTPGQCFYYKAILTDMMGNILAQGSQIQSVQFNSSLYGFQQLVLNTPCSFTVNPPYNTSNPDETYFYFEAPVDGVYAVETNGSNAANIKDNGGYPITGAMRQSNYLFGAPVKAGERIYVTASQTNGQPCSICVYEGLQKLPAATLGTQSVESAFEAPRRIPMHFTAPADGEYSFTTNSMAYMHVMDEGGSYLYNRGIYFRTPLSQGQVVWISGMERAPGDTLTIVQEPIPLRKLVFPAELTHLQDEACQGQLTDDVVFGNKIQSIGSRAFADCPNLRRVEIPVADVYIANDAFENSSNVILYAPIGGSVEQYAVNHGIMLEAMFP